MQDSGKWVKYLFIIVATVITLVFFFAVFPVLIKTLNGDILTTTTVKTYSTTYNFVDGAPEDLEDFVDWLYHYQNLGMTKLTFWDENEFVEVSDTVQYYFNNGTIHIKRARPYYPGEIEDIVIIDLNGNTFNFDPDELLELGVPLRVIVSLPS